MDFNNPPPPGEGMPSGQNESGHLFPGGHSYLSPLNAVLPPVFWGPPPLPQFYGFGPRPYHLSSLPVPPFGCGPPVFNVPPPSHPKASNVGYLTIDEDKIWLSDWLQSRTIKQHIKEPATKDSSIGEVQWKLRKWTDLLKEVEGHCEALQTELDTLSDTEWSARMTDIERRKSNISELVSSSFGEKPLADLQTKLRKRAKKRLRLKRQHAERRKDAHLAQLSRQSLHKKADAWLTDMQLATDRALKDEELKKEADSVLSEVTRRQSEGRRQTALLESLKKLHQARIQTMEARGTKLSADDKKNAARSSMVFDRLLTLWTKKMKEYAKEDHGLRVMLEESAAKQSDLEIQNVRQILGQWESFLFGSENSGTSDELSDIDTLISIRYAWDQYLVPDGAMVPMASSLPVGWVLPTTPSSPEWQKLLMP